MFNFPSNNNNFYTAEPHNHEKVNRAFPNTKRGVVIKADRNSHIGGAGYEVLLLDGSGITLKGCKLLNQSAGPNGIGTYVPLNIGSTCLVTFIDGILGEGEGYIIGGFTTEGDYHEFYNKGNLQKPEETLGNSNFNQPSGHPNRITTPDAVMQIYPDKTLKNAYDDPAYYIDKKEQNAAQPMPGVMNLITPNGDHVTYAPNSLTLYSEGNILQVSGGTRESSVARLIRYAQSHLNKAKALADLLPEGIGDKLFNSNEFNLLTDKISQAKSLPQQSPQALQNLNNQNPPPPETILETDTKYGHKKYPETAASDLVTVNGKRVHREAAQPLRDLIAAAKQDGVNITILSAFRSVSEQNSLFYDIAKQRGQSLEERAKVSAPPGYSEHHTGFAFDFGDANSPGTNLNNSFEQTKAFKWLAANAPARGFQMSFTGSGAVSRESWHWAWLGSSTARQLFNR